jgi:translation initiation factor IF-3
MFIYYPFKRPSLPKVSKELVNENIPFPTILVIDQNGTALGAMSKKQGMMEAEKAQLDLFCIAPAANPPVCRIMDFSKYKFEKKKQEKENKSKQTRPDLVKEIKITALTGPHDIETKVNQCIKLMQKGWRIKLAVYLKGRMITKIDAADDALRKMIVMLAPYGVIDKEPEKDGRLYFCYMSPIEKK